MKACFKFFVAILFFSIHLSAQNPGSLDATFGTNGVMTGSFDLKGKALAPLSNGKIIVACDSAYWPYGTTGVINCLNANGTYDQTFGNGGMAVVGVAGNVNAVNDMKLLSNGKFLILGTAYIGGGAKVYVAQFNGNGTLDLSFGNQGYALVDPLTAYSTAGAMEIQSDGKIVFCGNADFGQAMVVRLNTNGSLDNTFAANGIFLRPAFANEDIVLADLKIQSNGMIVTAGMRRNINGNTPVFSRTMILRLNANGTLDNNFANNGEALVNISASNYDEASQVQIQQDGKYLIAGCTSSNGWDNDIMVERLNVNGSVDINYGNNGFFVLDLFGANSYDHGMSSLLQADGKLLLHCQNTKNFVVAAHYYNLLRIQTNGVLDPVFGNQNGLEYHQVFSHDANVAFAIDFQPDGKVVAIGGSSTDINNNCGLPYFSAARYFVGDAVETGLGKNANGSKDIRLYPNPCADKITFSNIEPGSEIKLINVLGQVVKSKIMYESETSLDVSDLSNGIYSALVISNKNRTVSELVISK